MASRVISRMRGVNAHLLLLRASANPELLFGPLDICRPTSSTSQQCLPSQISHLPSFLREPIFQRFGFSSSASPRASNKEANHSRNHDHTSSVIPESSVESSEAGEVVGSPETNGGSSASEQSKEEGLSSQPEQIESKSSKKKRRAIKRTAFSDSDVEPDLSADELIKLIAEKDNLLKLKQKEIEKLQDKVLRTYAELENVLERTKREVENTKKYGVQNFAKSLLDVADNLGRASNVVKENFSKIDQDNDSDGVMLLKSLLEGVEMTEKQLAEVFRKFAIEKYDPLNEKFDPNRHNAIYEIPDSSKPPGTVASVMKMGYLLHDRVIRPAEVGVTKSPEGK
ncbi:hypothetical protein HPP92_020092 [Vanilla planifolia]|uniref:GrpE protein homolog n=1 Tax=Vanilla planifolia TaxID=51239 RepID=A0A835Q706_VANPL|nr:hypothetical protein HPP92_020092 [Vanilla planifolia]